VEARGRMLDASDIHTRPKRDERGTLILISFKSFQTKQRCLVDPEILTCSPTHGMMFGENAGRIIKIGNCIERHSGKIDSNPNEAGTDKLSRFRMKARVDPNERQGLK
jgi:hypothetical protein